MNRKFIIISSVIFAGIVVFLTMRFTCNKRDGAAGPSKLPDIEIPPARAVSGDYEIINDDYMDVAMKITAVSNAEASFEFTGTSRENRTVDMSGAAPVTRSLIWYDEEQDCSLYIDFLKGSATVYNECGDCCGYGVDFNGEYLRTRGASETDFVPGEYSLSVDEDNEDLSVMLRVTHDDGGAYSFRIDGENTRWETTGAISGATDVNRSLIWRDEDENCEVAILFGKGTAAVTNTCEYCCQWRAYIDGDYQRY